MFWGLNLKPNRKYTQTANKSFHISQAALDSSTIQGEGINQVFINCENQKYLICTLRKDHTEQVMLDLNFANGDEICFQSIGSGNVSLSGYVIEDDPMDFMNGGDNDVESEEEVQDDLRNKLLKKNKSKKEIKKNAASDNDDDEEEEESDDDEDEADEDDDDEEENEDEEDDEEEDEMNDSDEDEEEEVQQPKAKQIKLEKPQKNQNGAIKEAVSDKKKNEKKQKKENQKEVQQKPQQQSGGERTLSGGVKVEDLRVGSGHEIKVGKRAHVYYEGRLKSNNKIFDSLKQGSGFKFSVGRGEVIKGWDVGVVGMKLGGKRRITCPPHMAYGARGSPPTIPPNSTLVFDVELKAVN